MRLINTRTLTLTEFHGSAFTPPYAILSHTWEDEREVTLQDITTVPHAELALQKGKGFGKIRQTCSLARARGIDWAWVDTCFIDKTSSSELTEAINSMFRWYQRSQQVSKFARSRWFTRGWTLQELIAPRRVEFYNRDWQFEGDKSSLGAVLSKITRIRAEVLDDADQLRIVPVAQRMSAYCLLGIFGVNIPLLYGESEKAFIRLQEEIIKESNDLTLFAWRMKPKVAIAQTYWGILAPSPSEFAGCGDIEVWVDPMHNDGCVMTSKGLRVTPNLHGGLRLGEDGIYVMKLQCHRRKRTEKLGIFLQQLGCDMYTRVKPDKLAKTLSSENDKNRPFYVTKTVPTSRSVMLSTSIRNATNLSRALQTLAELGITPFSKGSMELEGHWDGQRKPMEDIQGLRLTWCWCVSWQMAGCR
ncbi:HET-domain-containing protein [Achaetomium macrosporum]|uniref:HET-domain-containing protein n=1 Tax=Achaetomium macrosporum TaxID=79813 RepID=A0AAN7HAZ2_9PEZI|nr:HET-domain-containing protein [Achaetomium macrosporum]